MNNIKNIEFKNNTPAFILKLLTIKLYKFYLILLLWFSPDLPDTSKRVDNMNLLRGNYEQKKIHTGIQRRSRIVADVRRRVAIGRVHP